MSIEEIKNRLDRFNDGTRIDYDPTDGLTLWPMLKETVADARYLLDENERLTKVLQSIYDATMEHKIAFDAGQEAFRKKEKELLQLQDIKEYP